MASFDEFLKRLDTKVGGGEPGWTSPELRAVLDSVQGTEAQRKKHIVDMKAHRAALFMANVSKTGGTKAMWNEGQVEESVQNFIDSLFDDVFSSVAFQTALVCTFTEASERAGTKGPLLEAMRAEYLDAINAFLRPRTQNQISNLVSVFKGELRIEEAQVRIVNTSSTFRAVVFPSEMKPTEWPKYRYLILELWRPQDPVLAGVIDADRNQCRRIVATSLVARGLAKFCEEAGKTEDEVTPDERKKVVSKAKSDYEALLGALNGKKVSIVDADFGPIKQAGEQQS